jgi:hypothetical protein
MGRKRLYEGLYLSEEIKRLYSSKKGLKQINVEVFQRWYESKNGCCDYCGLSSKES